MSNDHLSPNAMNPSDLSIDSLVTALPPITLEEMKSIRLMNRTDQKYLANVETLKKLLRAVQGLYYAQEVDGLHISPYATTYWDDASRGMYYSHQTGHVPRTKVRVRTYLSSHQTFLEVKNKDNHGKTFKSRVSVPSLDAVIEQGAGGDFLQEVTGLRLDSLVPTLSNRFSRITLVNYEKTERLTIDFNIHFYNHATQAQQLMDNIVVIELKRDGRVPSPILPILRELRIKPAGFSKYCIGATVTNPHLRINRFKKRLIRIRKVAESR